MNEVLPVSPIVTRRLVLQSLASASFLGVAGPMSAHAAGATPETDQSLAGPWRRALDPQDHGLTQGWHRQWLSEKGELPASLEQARIGNAVTTETPWTGDINDRSFFTSADYARYRRPGHVKVPFFLQPDSWYRGPAWYQRDIDIPADWRGKRVELFLERPHWATQVWLDDRSIGQSDALHVPHVYDLGALSPGRHRLSIRVDNRMIVEIGLNGHGVTDHTQGNWNGIAGRIELRATEATWIAQVSLDPVLSSRTLKVKGRIGSLAGTPGKTVAELSFAGRTVSAPITRSAGDWTFEAAITLGEDERAFLRPWDEFTPVLHEVTVRLDNGETWQGRFGWRELTASAKGFRINGRPMMFRGALECSIFPHTGHPAMDLESWCRIMRRVKDYGLNHLRFHSYCPPEAAFDAADEMGVYLQIETVWANQSVHIGSGLPVDRWVYAETDRVLAAHGHHPSFVLMTHGNEPGGGKAKDGEAKRNAFLGSYVRHYRALDRQRLWTAGSGWPEIDASQYHITQAPRIQDWGAELKSRINAKPPETRTDYRDFIGKRQVPVISHEIGQWCVYPNLAEVRKYTGHLKAKNFEIFADRLRDSGLIELAPEFLYTSGRLQVLCYKEDIESALRTEGMGGFQLLGLQDFPGQGTALVGVVDPFWDDKGYITAPEYRRFCDKTVALARMDTRVVQSGEPFDFTIDVAHFGSAAITDPDITWTITAHDGRTLARGSVATPVIPVGNRPLNLPARATLVAEQALAAKLTVRISAAGQQVTENDWDIWVYPRPVVALPKGVLETSQIDAAALQHLEQGGDVLVGLPPQKVANHAERPVKLGFSSIFWNTLWTERQAPTTLGIMCDPSHPGLRDFPTERHSNWQWWYLMHRAATLRLDVLPKGVTPIVRVIDDWFTARPLALVVELTVGKGRIIICGFELRGADAEDPVSRQLRASLVAYMGSDDFRPDTAVTTAQLLSLVQS